jgi:hypothetical protein
VPSKRITGCTSTRDAIKRNSDRRSTPAREPPRRPSEQPHVLRLPNRQPTARVDHIEVVALSALAIVAATTSERACHPTILVMSVATAS